MRYKNLEEAVERNIIKLFKTFYENPAIFWGEADVTSYLYSLLINDPFFESLSPHVKSGWGLKKASKTFLVHVNIEDETAVKRKIYDILILKPDKVIDELPYCEGTIGIEIKFNRRRPARDGKASILSDIKKAKNMRRGYVLWLNWAGDMNVIDLEKVTKLVKKYRNVKLFYLDVFSDPMKTNVRQLQNQKN